MADQFNEAITKIFEDLCTECHGSKYGPREPIRCQIRLRPPCDACGGTGKREDQERIEKEKATARQKS